MTTVQHRKRISLRTLPLLYRHTAANEPVCYRCSAAFSVRSDKQLRRHVHAPTLQRCAWTTLLCEDCEAAAALSAHSGAAYCYSCFAHSELTSVQTKDGAVVLCAACLALDAAQLAHKGAVVV